MNASRTRPESVISAETCPAEYSCTAGRPHAAATPTQSKREVAETILERMERYTIHLEKMVQRKNAEVNSLRRAMQSRIEEEKQKTVVSEKVMIHQARQAAMGELLGVVAHYWRQPLNVIALLMQNMNEVWDSGEFDDEFLDRSVSDAMVQVGILSRFIDDFRGLLKPAHNAGYFDPKQCVEEILGLLSGWYSNFSSYEIRVTDETAGSIRIAGSLNAFQQVILNILHNADEALQEQRRRIGQSFRGMIEICFRHTDEFVICIANNGGEIDESVTEFIFDPYFTTKNGNNGFGTGLYLSRIIIENNMNGSIWTESIPDGTLFGIRLPVLPAGRSCV